MTVRARRQSRAEWEAGPWPVAERAAAGNANGLLVAQMAAALAEYAAAACCPDCAERVRDALGAAVSAVLPGAAGPALMRSPMAWDVSTGGDQ